MRYVHLILALCGVMFFAASPAQAATHHHGKHAGKAGPGASAINDPRYADLIMNPVTGEVYHSMDPDGRRYPASLTKMMTLYLLFEALEQHKTTMDARFDVSEYAATMPQTNLALTPGDSIPVEVAIKALVVRSANDVAVVVGEALGGDVDHFGEMMTAKARQLGMSNTVFKNPNGLPNSEQYTTARDMAKLGIALKRDFPQYYPYFNTRQFSWNGVTYYTHNRVMLRYAGTDGIKTGFTGAAGFNLVTSVVRGGRPLVGVVMGGVSGGWRDNRMIQLLDGTYKQLSERGGARGRVYAANLPLKPGAKTGVGISPAAASAPVPEILTTKEDTTPDEGEDGTPTVAAVGDMASTHDAQPQPQAPKSAAKPVQVTTITTAITPPPAQPVPGANVPVAAMSQTMAKVVAVATASTQQWPNSPFAMASVEPLAPKPQPVAKPVAQVAPTTRPVAKPVAAGGNWGIQVGAFSSNELATQAAKTAYQLAPEALQGSQISIAGPANGSSVHRARLENLTQINAKKACERLISNNSPCFIFKVGTDS